MKSMLVGLGMVAAAASLGLVSCGGDTPSTASSVVEIGTTNYVTIPPTPVTIPIPTTAPDAPGSILPFDSEYTVLEGDYPSTVAAKFKVNFQAFLDANNFTLVDQIVPEWLGAGQVVVIPAGATVPGEPPPTVPTTAPPGGTATTQPPDDTDPPAPPTTLGGDCAPGSYTIEETDTSRQKVADKFDVSVAALDAANANTPYYSSFAPGVKIVIPAPSDC